MELKRAVRPKEPARKGRIWLCADDFALNDAVSEAIIGLLTRGRISMTSCMTGAPGWSQWGRALCDAGMVSRGGLHFNLTEPFPGHRAASLGTVMLRAALRRIDRARILGSLRRQLDAYETVMQRPPTFVDGHQHIHVLPVIRDILLAELTRRYTPRPWLRNVLPPADRVRVQPLKQTIIRAMGGDTFARSLQRASWPANGDFAGLYGLRPTADFGVLMHGWLAALWQSKSGLIMCHPALRAEEDDVIGPARVAEYAWFMSDAWPELLRTVGMDIQLDAAIVPDMA